ncbi:hypothetical protein PHIN3_228 [Sinorhizobium phage phiN3]|uniref:Uncharacterized protein n=1 Tax=Sinorhizobium phage phiN3 TaxID=1647405 RepID=A0A0F6YPS2_9CAUD|nr:hypothetical protein AVT40_gp305 [Sinorhizobium phage phiN3]AKF13491.1 hypothetical protein PHIN3_228 [Sinorhizobium phage phiN3]
MNVGEAIEDANKLNQTGEHREEWFYYPAWHEREFDWFVARRPKSTPVYVAIFTSGKRSISENGGR